MLINKGAEIGATITFGGMAGSRALATQSGRFLLGTEAAYNLGAGIWGKDITKPDENGNARQMPLLERSVRVTGGLFGARSVINAGKSPRRTRQLINSTIFSKTIRRNRKPRWLRRTVSESKVRKQKM